MSPIELTADNFDAIVRASDLPVLVDFWASWCGPCRALAPTVSQVAQELSGQLKVCKCDVDAQHELAARFHIVSIPTLILFEHGRAVHEMVGNMPKADLLKELSAFIH